MDAPLIEHTLERAAALGGDLTADVYARLFAAHPEMEPLFVRDTNGAVRGEMLARVFEMMLDFIDRRAYAARMIQCEVVTHDGYGVPPSVFAAFFIVVADTIRETLGAEWTGEAERAWRSLLADLTWYSTHPDQTLAPAVRSPRVGEHGDNSSQISRFRVCMAAATDRSQPNAPEAGLGGISAPRADRV
jgi:hemoglobin-like flavoprotein